MSCGTNNTDTKIAKFVDNHLNVVYGASTEAGLSFCKFIDDVTSYELTEIKIPAKSSKTVFLDGDKWKTIAFKVIYGATVDIANQRVFYTTSEYLIDPISKKPSLYNDDLVKYTSQLPAVSIDFALNLSADDIIDISGIRLIADTDFVVDVDPLITLDNLVTAINDNEFLSDYILATASTTFLNITAKDPSRSYSLIKFKLTTTSTLTTLGFETYLSEELSVVDRMIPVHQIGIVNNPTGLELESLKFYNFESTAVTVQLLKFI